MQMVPDHLIRAKTTSLSALNLCINLAVDADSEEKKELNDKKICAALGNMDKAQFSKIKSGTAHLAENLRIPLQVACGNYAMLQYEALAFGFGLHRLKTRLEQELEDLQEKLLESERKNAWLLEMLNGNRQ